MAYCTAAEVQADFKAVVFTTTSLVTLAAVTQFIVEADALINSYVGQRWVTPIASGESANLMKLYSRTLVAERVRAILSNNQQSNQDANQNVRGSGLTSKDVMKALNDIKNGDMQLVSGTLINTDATMRSNNSSSNTQPRFRKNRRQW